MAFKIMNSKMIIALCLVCVFGCSRIENKRDASLERLDWSGGRSNDVLVQCRNKLVDALKSASTAELRQPILVNAVMHLSNSNEIRGPLKLDWICVAPAANGAILVTTNGVQVFLPFMDEFMKENEKESRSILVFQGAVYKQDSEQLWNTIDFRALKGVALGQNGAQVSKIVPIEFVDKL